MKGRGVFKFLEFLVPNVFPFSSQYVTQVPTNSQSSSQCVFKHVANSTPLCPIGFAQCCPLVAHITQQILGFICSYVWSQDNVSVNFWPFGLQHYGGGSSCPLNHLQYTKSKTWWGWSWACRRQGCKAKWLQPISTQIMHWTLAKYPCCTNFNEWKLLPAVLFPVGLIR